MRYLTACLLLFLLWFGAGYEWGSGMAGGAAYMANKAALTAVGIFVFLVLVCFDQKIRRSLKLFYACLFCTIYLGSNCIFGLGLVLHFKMYESNVVSAVQEVGRCELKTKTGQIIVRRCGTGHNSAYVQCTSGKGSMTGKRYLFQSGVFKLIWDLNGD